MIDLSFIRLPNIDPPNLSYGFVIGVITMFFSGHFKEYFAERDRKKQYKIDVANNLQKIVIEASTKNYNVSPRDYEHINSVLSDVRGLDKDIGKLAREYVEIWKVIAETLAVDRSIYDRDKTEANKIRRKLEVWIHKIKN